MDFIREHKKGIIVICAGIALMAIVIITSIMFILNSKEKVTLRAEFSMEGPTEESVQFSGFTREDGNISLTFTGNIPLFDGVRGSVQGTIENAGNAAEGRLIKITEPFYERTISLRAAHYTTYVIIPEHAQIPFGAWAIAIVDDQQAEPTSLFWMNLNEGGFASVGKSDDIAPNDNWISKIENDHSEQMAWTYGNDGTFHFNSLSGYAFQFQAETM